MDIEHSRGFSGLTIPEASASPQMVSFDLIVMAAIMADPSRLEAEEAQYDAIMLAAWDRRCMAKRYSPAVIEEIDHGTGDVAPDENDYDDQFVDDDSDYRLFRRIDSLPAQIGSHRAVYDEYGCWRRHIGKRYGHGHRSRSMDRAKHRRRSV